MSDRLCDWARLHVFVQLPGIQSEAKAASDPNILRRGWCFIRKIRFDATGDIRDRIIARIGALEQPANGTTQGTAFSFWSSVFDPIPRVFLHVYMISVISFLQCIGFPLSTPFLYTFIHLHAACTPLRGSCRRRSSRRRLLHMFYRASYM